MTRITEDELTKSGGQILCHEVRIDNEFGGSVFSKALCFDHHVLVLEGNVYQKPLEVALRLSLTNTEEAKKIYAAFMQNDYEIIIWRKGESNDIDPTSI